MADNKNKINDNNKFSLNNIISSINKILFKKDPTNLLTDEVIDKVYNIINNKHNLGSYEIQSDFTTLLMKLAELDIEEKDKIENIEKYKELKSKKIIQDITKDEELFSAITSDIEFTSRLARYKQYDYLVKSIGRLKRALDVTTANILSPDYVSKEIGDFSFDDDYLYQNDEDEIRSRYEDIDKYIIDLNKIADKIVFKTLKYGDCFIEIKDIKEEVLKKKKLLLLSSEGEKYLKYQNVINNGDENIIEKFQDNIVFETSINVNNEDQKEDKKIIFEQDVEIIFEMPPIEIESLIMESIENQEKIIMMEAGRKHKSDPTDEDDVREDLDINSDEEDIPDINKTLKETKQTIDEVFKETKRKKYKKVAFNRYYIKLLDPYQVIRLGTDEISFGYLVFPKEYVQNFLISLSAGSSPNNFLKKGSATINVSDLNNPNVNSVRRVFIEKLYNKIINILKYKFGDIIDEINYNDLKTLNNILNSFIQYASSNTGLSVSSDVLKMKIRYVPDNRMVHFKINEDEFSPYGTSILNPVLFDSKLLLGIKTANTMDSIANSRDNLVINFDIDYSNDITDYMQAIKRKLRQMKIIFDDNLTVDAIPSLISNFEAFYLPRREDKTYLSMEYLTKKDTSMNSDLLKYQRDETISGLDIPPAYLGIEENLESKSTLSFENVIFASSILRKQKQFNNLFTELYRKIYYFIYKELDISCQFELRPPLLLIVYTIIDLINNFSSVYDFLVSNVGLDKDDVVKEFMPYLNKFFDMDKLLEKKINKISNIASGGANQQQGENQEGMF